MQTMEPLEVAKARSATMTGGGGLIQLRKSTPVCPIEIQRRYLNQVVERNNQEKTALKELFHQYMEMLKALSNMQERVKILERENYALKQTKG